MENFFESGNLIALREITLRRAANRVDEQMREYLRNLPDRRALADQRSVFWYVSAAVPTASGSFAPPAGWRKS